MSMSLRDQLLAAGLINQKQARDAERASEQQQRGQQHREKHKKDQRRGGPAGQGQSQGQGQAQGAQAKASSPNPAGGAGGVAGAGKQGASGSVSHAQPAAAGIPHAKSLQSAQSAKIARDQALNKAQQAKADKKARAAQIKQLIAQNRVARPESDDHYNFVDDNRIRFISVDAALRARILGGELVIVRHEGRYDLVPKAIAERIRERDERAVIATVAAAQTAAVDDAYKDFAVPDDLMW